MAHKFIDTEAYDDECVLHLVDYISGHIRFDLEKYLLNSKLVENFNKAINTRCSGNLRFNVLLPWQQIKRFLP